MTYCVYNGFLNPCTSFVCVLCLWFIQLFICLLQQDVHLLIISIRISIKKVFEIEMSLFLCII